jgi:hypothetical protein
MDIVNNATMNVWCYVLRIKIFIVFNMYLKVGLQNQLPKVGSSTFKFWGTSIVIFVAALFDIPKVFKNSDFSTFWPTLSDFCYSHPNRYEMICHYCFYLFQMICDLSIFSQTYWLFVCFLWRNVYSRSLTIFYHWDIYRYLLLTLKPMD